MVAVAGNTRFSVGDNFTKPLANAFPRGCFSYSVQTSSSTLSLTNTAYSQVNWTAESTRVYRITYFEPQVLLPSPAGAYVDMTIRVNLATGTQVALARSSSPITTCDMVCSVILTGLSGSVTYVGCLVASSLTGAPTATRSATQQSVMLVEDIGGT